ncbi:MAG: MATE family efflux transporter [Bacteroidales bacterium]|nr:MATE family efflux transporter [Bacteroidales bacterium]MDD4671695.1 MATE family efflux transporter [Bacteroidales bacterium]
MNSSISYKRIWAIAYPIIIGSIAQNIINVTDTAFIGQLGEISLGGGAIGGLFYMTLIMFGWGFGIGTQIVVARRFGEGAFRPIGRTVDHGYLFLMLLALLIFTVVKLFGYDILNLIVDSDAIKHASSEFIQYRIWGIFFAHTNFIFRAFYIGIGKTKVITLTTLVMVAVNVFQDYGLIFGNFGLPAMGISGAALASVIAEITCSVAFLIFTVSKIPRDRYRLFKFRVFSPRLLLRLLRISTPMMLQNFFAFGVWFVFFLIIEKMGESELAVSNIVRSIYVILMVPIMGFASATNTLVSYVIGKGDVDDVMRIIKKILLMSTSSVLLIVGTCALIPEKLLSIYTSDQHLIDMGIPIIYIISFSSVMLGIGNILFSGVSGTGKTNVSLIIEIGLLSIYLAFTAVVVIVFAAPVEVVWGVELVYGGLLSITSYLYLRSKKWVGSSV